MDEDGRAYSRPGYSYSTGVQKKERLLQWQKSEVKHNFGRGERI